MEQFHVDLNDRRDSSLGQYVKENFKREAITMMTLISYNGSLDFNFSNVESNPYGTELVLTITSTKAEDSWDSIITEANKYAKVKGALIDVVNSSDKKLQLKFKWLPLESSIYKGPSFEFRALLYKAAVEDALKKDEVLSKNPNLQVFVYKNSDHTIIDIQVVCDPNNLDKYEHLMRSACEFFKGNLEVRVISKHSEERISTIYTAKFSLKF